ncbi:MAG: hypothetical protein ACM3YM_04480 [Sphingomonadales bacterium]
MSPGSTQAAIANPGPSPRQRAAALTLVGLLHLLLLLLLLRLASPVLPEKTAAPVATLTVINMPKATPDTTRAAKARSGHAERSQPVRQQPDKRPAPAPAQKMDAARAAAIWSQVIPLTRQQVASVDSAMTAPHPPQQSADAGQTGATSEGETDDSEGPGTGPNGETLYNARWYREPTRAELSTYLPPDSRRSGWGMIACKTAPRYRVEDCVAIGQSPGSGLAEAVRQAAWQFLVFPPRIGGRLMVGSWVRIRIDYTVTAAK